VSERIGMDLATLSDFLQDQPSFSMLAACQQSWNAWQAQVAASLTLLTQAVGKDQDALNQLAEMNRTWRETRVAAQTNIVRTWSGADMIVPNAQSQLITGRVVKCFAEFGDSALNFELRAWTDQFDRWYQVRSDLATGIYEAGNAAGLSFPVPQREVRMLPDAPGDGHDRRDVRR